VSPPTAAALAAERAAYREAAVRAPGAREPVAGVVEVTAAGRPAALYVPRAAPQTGGLLVWLHGGGWYLGDLATFDRAARLLANASGARVLLPDYRLAPEHPWPAAVDDAAAIVAWAREDDGARSLGIDPARVAVGGDSAGGQLAAVAVRRARGDGRPPVVAQLLAYPALDPRLDSASARAFADDPNLARADMERCWALYLGAADPAHADVDVLREGDTGGLPPSWIAVAGRDLLRDDGLRYAARLRDAGVPVAERRFEALGHGFLRLGGAAAHELAAWLGAALR